MSRIVYIAKPNEWFDAGTEVELIVDCRPDGVNLGIFRGYHNGELDEEDCPFDEFDIIEILDKSELNKSEE